MQGRGMRHCNGCVGRWYDAAAIDDILRHVATVAVAGYLTGSVVPRAHHGRGRIMLTTKHTTINHNDNVTRDDVVGGRWYATANGDIARDVAAVTASRDLTGSMCRWAWLEILRNSVEFRYFFQFWPFLFRIFLLSDVF